MKLFDIVAGKVVIHPDALAVPCFNRLWEKYKDKNDLATKYFSYIVFKNKYDSPYVKTMSPEDIPGKLKHELFGDKDYKLPEDVLKAEEEYQSFSNTLLLQLLEGARLKVMSIAKYYKSSLEDELDDKKVETIYKGMDKMGGTIRSLDLLETQVKNEELMNSRIKGGKEVNPLELPH